MVNVGSIPTQFLIKNTHMKKLKSKLARAIYDFLYYLDEKRNKIEDYSYETAPYCGYHFNGHRGYFTNSSYHEGMGGCSAKFLFIWVYKNSEEPYWDMGITKK
jgi:hypothetical protein